MWWVVSLLTCACFYRLGLSTQSWVRRHNVVLRQSRGSNDFDDDATSYSLYLEGCRKRFSLKCDNSEIERLDAVNEAIDRRKRTVR
jgi:hypothetical protein